jgi:hypothetical protein
MFCAFRRFEEIQLDSWFSNFKKSLWKLEDRWKYVLYKFSKQMTLDYKSLNKTSKVMTGYVCAHVRLKDFGEYCEFLKKTAAVRYNACQPSLNLITKRIKHQSFVRTEQGKLKTLKAVFIATDDVDEFYKRNPRNLKRNFMIYTKNDLLKFLKPYIQENYDELIEEILESVMEKEIDIRKMYTREILEDMLLPFLEQEICIRANSFVGNKYSTFSKNIVRRRNSRNVAFY